jgi:hypothetical protein
MVRASPPDILADLAVSWAILADVGLVTLRPVVRAPATRFLAAIISKWR